MFFFALSKMNYAKSGPCYKIPQNLLIFSSCQITPGAGNFGFHVKELCAGDAGGHGAGRVSDIWPLPAGPTHRSLPTQMN